MKVTNDMCELIGAIIGDGNIYSKRPYYVEITGNQTLDLHYFKERLLSLIKSELDYTPRLFQHERAIRLRINSKEFVLWLKEIGIPSESKKYYNVEIPDVIYHSLNYTKRCIRGIFDTDGFIYWDKRKKPYPRLGITTCSKKLFNQIVEILKLLGFSKMYLRFDKRGAYNIEIYSQSQLDKWMEIIGSSNKKHLNKLMPQ